MEKGKEMQREEETKEEKL